MSDNPYRLPRTALPRRYEIRLEPDLEAFTFDGEVTIELDIVEDSDSIALNALEIEIDQAMLTDSDGALEGTVSYDEPMQRAILTFERTLAQGPAELSIRFRGILNDQLVGFYRSKFTDVDGVEQVIATTQFEATDARRAFPCFDEPDMKATFAVTLVVPDHLLAVSNGAESSRLTLDDGRVAVSFAETMKMSTYLVAFVVGPFEATEPVDVDGVPLRVIAPKGKEHLTSFALECGEFCLRYLTSYYDIPYPGDKVDMIAIPDFAFGAMENLGCITFRETALLVDPETATQAELVRILDVVAHELAHMWFGDLVTMKWWDGIWLNEAFASFMEMKATDAMKPEWKRWLAFSAVERPWAYDTDSLQASRPVEFEVTSPEEANEMFDALTYGKGSSVLRQIEQYLGDEVFRQGVGDYLRTHAYGNTVTRDLWAGLDRASGIDVGAIMDTWILQKGFPQVDVSLADGGLRLHQRRFLFIPDESDQTLWKIPVQIRGASDGRPFESRTMLDAASGEVEIDGPIDWAVVNAGGHGFYRVSYSEPLAKALRTNIDQLDDNERYVLISDTWAMVESGQAGAAALLELASAYKDETEYAIWQAVVGALASLKHHAVGDDDLPAFHSLVRDIVGPTAARLGWEPREGESDLTRSLRGLVIGALGRTAADPDTVERSRAVGREWMSDPKSTDPDVGQSSLFTLAANGNEEDYTEVFTAYRAAKTPQIELRLLQAITFFDDPVHVDRTLDAIREGTVRNQDGSWVAARLLGGRRSGTHAWKRLREDWSALTGLMPPLTLRRLVEGLPALSRPDVAQDVQSFLAETKVQHAEKATSQNLERLRANVLLRERESGALSRFLAERS
ncbi:MAG TPA: M1 family metallopeptidase [Acidimicrobiia bacterium]|nr:M1 family metallopeptidase [Acidimicrobiia bacterium]